MPRITLPNANITRSLHDADATLEASGELVSDMAVASLRCGPFELTQLIGKGGMGQVYLAKRIEGGFEQSVAIKLVRSAAINGAESAFNAHHAARFSVERNVLARLQHPNIAALIDAGELASGELWIAMEYVDGQTLDQYLLRSELGQNQIVALLSTLAQAVAYAERQLIVHRDLKPSNIMIDRSGMLKLLDFGIAKLLGPGDSNDLTQIQPYSPRYAAPEQLKNGTITTATNVYQLGLLSRDFLNSPLDQDLNALVRCALQEHPSDRYANAGAMAQDFDAWLAHKPLQARQLNIGAQTWKFIRRQPVVSGILAAALAGVMLFASIAYTQAQLAKAALQLAKTEQQSSEVVIEKLRAGFSSISPSTLGKPALLSDLLEFWRTRSAGADLHADGRVMVLAGELSFALGDYPQARALLTKGLAQIEPKRSESAIKDAAKAAGLLGWIDNVEGKTAAAIDSIHIELSLLAQLPPTIERELLIGKAQYLRLSHQALPLQAAQIAEQTAEKLLAGTEAQKAHRLVFLSRAYQSFLAANSAERANHIAALLQAGLGKTTSAKLVNAMLPDEVHANDGLFSLLDVANAAGRIGNREFAEGLLAALAKAGQGAFGESHPFAAQFSFNYAMALLNSGKLRLADSVNRPAVAVVNLHSRQFPQLLYSAIYTQGAISRSLGDSEAAADYYLQAAKIADDLQDDRNALLSLAQRLRAIAEFLQANPAHSSAKTLPVEYAEFIARWSKAPSSAQNNEARFAIATAAALALDSDAKAYWQADLTALKVPESARFKRELALIYLQHASNPTAAISNAQALLKNLPAGTALISQYSLIADAALWQLTINPKDIAARSDAERALAWLRVEMLPDAVRLKRLNEALTRRSD